ncbi:hypothetical protein GCM10028790_64100 [Micromonospora taraxaci]
MTRARRQSLFALLGGTLWLAAGIGLLLRWHGLGVWLLTGASLLALHWSRGSRGPEVEPTQEEPHSTDKALG